MKSRSVFLTLVGLLLGSPVSGQKVQVRSIEATQAYAPMQGRTGEIVQSLPGERVIEKEAVNGKTVLYYLDKEGKRTKIYEGGAVDYFTHSRTGERICFKAQGEFVVRDLTTQQEFRFQTVDSPYLNGFANISPDGDKVVFDKSELQRRANYSANDYLIVTRDLSTKEERVIGNGSFPKWSSDSKQIVFGRADGYIAH